MIGGRVIHSIKHADDLVLLAKKEEILQDIMDRLEKTGKNYEQKSIQTSQE